MALAEAQRHDRADLQARLARERGRLATSSCLVAVVGEFKQGKGTLVNALLGVRVCGTDPVATTLVPTVVRYASLPTAAVVYADPADAGRVGDSPAADTGAQRGDAQRADLDLDLGPDLGPAPAEAGPRPARPGRGPAAGGPITIADLHALTQADPTEARLAAAALSGAEIGVPRRLLESGLTLLDTPGLNGGLADGRATATLRAAAGADAVVFVSDASQELIAPELDLLRRLVLVCPTVVLAVTKVDVYPDWRRIVDTDLTHLRHAGLDLPAFPLAAPLRHHALRTGQAEVDAESGYPALAAHLRDEVVGGRRARLERAATDAATDTLRQLLGELETRRATLADPAAARELKASLDEAERLAKEMGEAAAGWQRMLTDRSQDMTVTLRDDLDRRLRAVESAATERIEAGEPAREWDDLRGWLFGQTNDALLTHRMMVSSEAQALVAAVTREFEAAAQPVYALLDATAAARPVTAVDTGRAPDFQRLGGVDLLTHGIRGGSAGMMLVSVAGTVAGLAGLAASAFLAPVGIGVLVVLGRRAIASVRENELRAHRASALKAAREYLAEAHRVAAADSAATRDQIYRTVRDTLAQQATELAASAQRNRQSSARAIKTTWDARRAELAAVEADLARLRPLVDAGRHPGPAG